MKISFFKSAITAVVIALFFSNAHANQKRQPTVIVIGAGVAGLAAAQELKNHHIPALILEARNRIGGRIHTVSPWGVGVDLGAAWIHGVKNNPFTDMANRLHIMMAPSVYNDNDELRLFATYALYNQGGVRVSDHLLAKEVKYLSGFEEFLSTHKAELYLHSFKDAIHNYEYQQGVTLNESRLIDYLLRISYTFEFAADIEDLAADADVPYEGSKVYGENVFPIGGYGGYLPYLSRDLEIRLNQRVNKIDYHANGVDVYTDRGQYHADYAIVTVPLGVLKSGRIKFIPDLPKFKRDAIRQLKMGVYDKIILHFDYAFWDLDKEWMGILPNSNRPADIMEIMNLGKFTHQPDLLIFTAGDYAKTVESWSDEETLEVSMRMLRKLYGNNIPKPTRYVITRWNSDPYTLGSYSYLPKNVHYSVYRKMSAPVNNKVFFAGEATSKTDMATVHGAYATGIRAAKQVVSVMR